MMCRELADVEAACNWSSFLTRLACRQMGQALRIFLPRQQCRKSRLPGHSHNIGDHRCQLDVGIFEHFLDAIDQAGTFLEQTHPRPRQITNGLVLDSLE